MIDRGSLSDAMTVFSVSGGAKRKVRIGCCRVPVNWIENGSRRTQLCTSASTEGEEANPSRKLNVTSTGWTSPRPTRSCHRLDFRVPAGSSRVILAVPTSDGVAIDPTSRRSASR